MEEIEKLQYQEQILIQELELVRAKLKYVRLCQQSEPQKEISSPSSSQSKDEAIPGFPAPGKESSNPVIASSLLKAVTEVQTSRTLVTPSDFVLKPNGGILIPKTKDSALVSANTDQGIQIPNKKDFYVVYNGPNAGIYTNWDITKKATDGVPNIQHKKFKTFLEAKTSADIFTRTKMLPPLQIIQSAEGLRPNNFCEALKTKKSKQVSLGKLPVKHQKQIDEDSSVKSEEIKLNDFEYCYKEARRADETKFVEEHYFTTDGKNLSHYNFVQNADPEQVYEAFQLGLVKQIYPSNNLLELSHFPRQLISSIKNFRKKCAKPDTSIFLKINSTIPVWNDEAELVYTPHHLIQIGISKEVNYHPSKPMEAKIEKGDLNNLAKRRLEDFCNKAFSFFADSKIFINYQDDRKLIYSKIGKVISSEDDQKFFRFQQSILRPNLFGAHYNDVCKTLKNHSLEYSCERCFEKAKGPAIEDSGSPTTNKVKKEDKSQKEKDDL